MTSNIKIQVFIVSLIFTMLSAFLQISPIVTSDFILEKLSIDSSLVLELTSLYFISYAILQVPVGFILDYKGFNWMLPVSIFIVLIGCILYWQVSNGWMLGVSRFTIGIGCSTAYIGTIFIAANYFEDRFLPFLIGMVEVSTSLGNYLANNVYLSILNKYGWFASNLIVISAFLLLFIYSFFDKVSNG